jgi:hypothetical protein
MAGMTTMRWPGYDHAPSEQPRIAVPPTLESPPPAEPSEEVNELIARLVRTQNGRQAVADGLWARVPAYVEEYGYAEVAGSLTVVSQTKQLERITCIIATVPSGATAHLILGQRISIPLVSGVNILSPISILLQPSDPRSLQLDGGATGTLTLLLTGEQQAVYGQIR